MIWSEKTYCILSFINCSLIRKVIKIQILYLMYNLEEKIYKLTYSKL